MNIHQKQFNYLCVQILIKVKYPETVKSNHHNTKSMYQKISEKHTVI